MRSSTTALQMPFSRGHTSRVICVIGLIACWIFCSAFLVLGIFVYRRGCVTVRLGRISREIVALGINISVTLFNEVVGYIHGLSLRWALHAEGRLDFNTNMRLGTGVKTATSLLNTWYSNVLMTLGLVVSYSSVPLIFLGSDPSTDLGIAFVSGLAIILCTSALLFQASVATFCLLSPIAIPTWSSDPIDNAVACLASDIRPKLQRIPNRCMRSVHDQGQDSCPVLPRRRQGSAYRAHRRIGFVIRWLWAAVLESLLMGVIMIVVTQANSRDINWSLLPGPGSPGANIGWDVDGHTGMITDATLLRGFGVLSGLQALITFATHCAELQVNCFRDESIWRAAGGPGLQRDTNVVIRALSSWPTVSLLIAKPVLHWMYGLSVSAWFYGGIRIAPVQMLYLTIAAIALAIFITCIANHKPKGPQPATYGHLQTIINLGDQWPALDQRLYWGHSGRVNGIAHAGTSGRKLGEIHMTEQYMGENDR